MRETKIEYTTMSLHRNGKSLIHVKWININTQLPLLHPSHPQSGLGSADCLCPRTLN